MGKQVRAFWGGGGWGDFFSMIFLEEKGEAIIASVHLGALLLVGCNQICPSTALFSLRDVFHCGWLQGHHLDVFSIRTGRQKSPKDVETPSNNDLIFNVFQLPVKTADAKVSAETTIVHAATSVGQPNVTLGESCVWVWSVWVKTQIRQTSLKGLSGQVPFTKRKQDKRWYRVFW